MVKIKAIFYDYIDMTVIVKYTNGQCVYPFFDIKSMNDFIKKLRQPETAKQSDDLQDDDIPF